MINLPSVAGIQAWFVANGLKLVIFALLITGAYFKGRDDMHDKIAGREAKVLTKALEVQAREAKVEAAEAAAAARAKQELDNKLESALGELNEAIDKVPSNPNCDLRPDELQFFRDLQGTP